MPNDPRGHQRPRINIGLVGNITGGTVIALDQATASRQRWTRTPA